jgi:hypothetical protein
MKSKLRGKTTNNARTKNPKRSSVKRITRFRANIYVYASFALFITIFGLLGVVSISNSKAATTTAHACIGAPANEPNGGLYPEPRQFIDSQSWWRPIEGQNGTDHGHIHVGACIPERQTMTGNFTLNIRMMAHDVGAVKVYSGTTSVPYTSVVLKDDNIEKTQTKLYETGWQCSGTCERWRSVTVDTSPFTTDGLKEIRFRFFFDVLDGTETARMTASSNWQFKLDRSNVTAIDDFTRNSYSRGKGWYSKPGSLSTGGYCEADYLSMPLPDEPVSGIWQPKVKMVWHGSSTDPQITSHEIRLDPDFHASPINEGMIVRKGTGAFNDYVSIDTTKLINGTHKLFLRAICNDQYNRGSAIHGIQIIPFVVSN